MERIKIDIVSVAADADGFANATVCTGAGPWSPNVATSVSDGLAHKVTITQAGATNHSAKTATITGEDANGGAQVETGLALPNGAATVTSTKYFKTVSSIAVSATIGADTMTAGYAAASVSPWKAVEAKGTLGVSCEVTTGAPTYTVEGTVDGKVVFDVATRPNETVSSAGPITMPVRSIRLRTSAAGGVKMTAIAG